MINKLHFIYLVKYRSWSFRECNLCKILSGWYKSNHHCAKSITILLLREQKTVIYYQSKFNDQINFVLHLTVLDTIGNLSIEHLSKVYVGMWVFTCVCAQIVFTQLYSMIATIPNLIWYNWFVIVSLLCLNY